MSERADVHFGFQRLRVWQDAVGFAGMICEITKGFPREEAFGLTSQLRRAAVSVAANIAEGTSRSSGRDQARFFEIAYGSVNEVVTMAYVASGQGFIQDSDIERICKTACDLSKMLSGLRRKCLKQAD